MKNLFFLIAFALLAACTDPGTNSQENGEAATNSTPVEQTVAADTIASPVGFTKLGEATGDLDKDGVDEMALIYDTGKEGEIGTEREIHIFKQTNGTWELWHKSTGAVMASQSGGVMGDPFQDAKVENGSLVITHFGGSRSKWTYTHRFRFQNGDWQLIGATSHSGAPCEYFVNVDYNLSTGKIIFTKEIENCDNEEDVKTIKETKDFVIKSAKLPSMDGFNPGANELKLPKVEDAVYY